MNLSTIDLNLLLVLAVVLEERSATRAAQRLGVTQSAVSNALARLRELLGDPLMVRSGRGLVPTPRAAELAPSLRSAMAQLQAAVERSGFDPRETSRQLTLACADAQQIHDVPRIAAALAEHMPRASLRVVSIDYLLATSGLATGEVDVAFGPPPDREGLFYEPLYRDQGVVVVRRDHPLVRTRMTRKLFNALQHVDILIALGHAGRGHDAAERVLKQHGLHRRVALAVPSFAAAVMTAAHTDYAAAVPRRVAEALAAYLPIKVLALPMRGLAIEIGMLWHARSHESPSDRYFRALIGRAIGDREHVPRSRRGAGKP